VAENQSIHSMNILIKYFGIELALALVRAVAAGPLGVCARGRAGGRREHGVAVRRKWVGLAAGGPRVVGAGDHTRALNVVPRVVGGAAVATEIQKGIP
jgi:hypothetical protein